MLGISDSTKAIVRFLIFPIISSNTIFVIYPATYTHFDFRCLQSLVHLLLTCQQEAHELHRQGVAEVFTVRQLLPH